jgi:hypothetical protein
VVVRQWVGCGPQWVVLSSGTIALCMYIHLLGVSIACHARDLRVQQC